MQMTTDYEKEVYTIIKKTIQRKKRKHLPYKPLLQETIVDLYKSGKTFEEIGNLLGYTKQNIHLIWLSATNTLERKYLRTSRQISAYTCIICHQTFYNRKNKKKKTCSKSCLSKLHTQRLKQAWQNGKFKEKMQRDSISYREKQRERMKKQWQNPEFRKKMQQRIWSPEQKEKHRKGLQQAWFNNPELRKKHAERMKKMWTPELRKQRSELLKKMWQELKNEEKRV